MTRKLYIKTYGCQMNEYDSAKIADVLGASHGMTTTQVAAEADVLLLNTCSIRERAQEKVFSLLGVWRELKEANPNLIIGVGGCVAGDELHFFAKDAGAVQIFFRERLQHPAVAFTIQVLDRQLESTQLVRALVGIGAGLGHVEPQRNGAALGRVGIAGMGGRPRGAGKDGGQGKPGAGCGPGAQQPAACKVRSCHENLPLRQVSVGSGPRTVPLSGLLAECSKEEIHSTQHSGNGQDMLKT